MLTLSGERLPILKNSSSGEPIYDVATYVVSNLRSTKAANTIESALRAISIFYTFLDKHRIDLEERLGTGELLSNGEIDELVRMCKKPMRALRNERKDIYPEVKPQRISTLENVRMRSPTGVESAEITSGASRVRQIRNYLDWLANGRFHQLSSDSNVRAQRQKDIARVLKAINARMPSGRSRGTLNARKGIDKETEVRLMDVITPGNAENPWKSRDTQVRNRLIIHILIKLGIRRGELLGIRIRDINFQKLTICIVRNADSKDDPRKRQPLVKTLSRLLPITPETASLISDYVLSHRAGKFPGLKHDYLIVGNGVRKPLSLIALNKVFEVLRTKCPDLPDFLKPHDLRHTWNDRYSEIADSRGMTTATEQKTRTYMMGWGPTSRMAAVYSLRHTQEEAREASLAMQKKLMERIKK